MTHEHVQGHVDQCESNHSANVLCSASDLLLSRAVQGDRDAMATICASSATNPSLLQELAAWQADELRLARAARELDVYADNASLPQADARALRRDGLGWLVAAILVVALAGDRFLAAPTHERVNVAGIAGPTISTADQAFDAYLEKGRAEGLVLGDVAPPTFVQSRELGEGRGFEVIVMRQIYERRTMPQMYRMEPTGETGRMRAVVVRPRTDLLQ